MARKNDTDRAQGAGAERAAAPEPAALAIDPIEFVALLSRVEDLAARVRSLELRVRHIV